MATDLRPWPGDRVVVTYVGREPRFGVVVEVGDHPEHVGPWRVVVEVAPGEVIDLVWSPGSPGLDKVRP